MTTVGRFCLPVLGQTAKERWGPQVQSKFEMPEGCPNADCMKMYLCLTYRRAMPKVPKLEISVKTSGFFHFITELCLGLRSSNDGWKEGTKQELRWCVQRRAEPRNDRECVRESQRSCDDSTEVMVTVEGREEEETVGMGRGLGRRRGRNEKENKTMKRKRKKGENTKEMEEEKRSRTKKKRIGEK